MWVIENLTQNLIEDGEFETKEEAEEQVLYWQEKVEPDEFRIFEEY
jgi:hypothetical protein